MYYDAAMKNLWLAKDAIPNIDSATAAANATQKKIDALNKSGFSMTVEFERLAIQIESEETRLSAAYGPYLQHLASVHILAAASLEAHINQRAKSEFSGSMWDTFERCSLEAKWMFFPHLRDCDAFDTGAEPFQGFGRLIKRRNDLTHYKPRREAWQSAGVPAFLDNLGLTIDHGEASIRTAEQMIVKLAVMLGEEAPLWFLAEGRLGYFQMEIESTPRTKRN